MCERETEREKKVRETVITNGMLQRRVMEMLEGRYKQQVICVREREEKKRVCDCYGQRDAPEKNS